MTKKLDRLVAHPLFSHALMGEFTLPDDPDTTHRLGSIVFTAIAMSTHEQALPQRVEGIGALYKNTKLRIWTVHDRFDYIRELIVVELEGVEGDKLRVERDQGRRDEALIKVDEFAPIGLVDGAALDGLRDEITNRAQAIFTSGLETQDL